MTRNKKLAKRIGCGLLAGTLLASSFVPFSNNTLVAKASSSLLTKDNTININDNITYTNSSGHVLVLDKANCEYIKHENDIYDDYGNLYTGDIVKLSYCLPVGAAWNDFYEQYCVVNLKCVKNPNEATIKEAIVPRTVTERIGSETKALPVIELGENAFKNSTYTTVKIPDTVIKISDSAFRNSSNLEKVVFLNEDGKTTNSGENLMEIGSYAFAGCSKLTTATIPAQLIEAKVNDEGNFASSLADYIGCNNKFGSDVFRDCVSLTQVTIGNDSNKNIEIPDNTFAGCKALEKIEFAENIKNVLIGKSAFAGLDKLKKLTLDFDVVVSSYAFSNDTNLINVEFNGNVTENRYDSYGGARGLFKGSFLVGNSDEQPTVKFNASKKNPSEKLTVTIPANCFEIATGLKKVEFSKEVDTVIINKYAFTNTGIEELKFDCKNVEVRERGLSALGSHTKSVVFNNSEMTTLYPECFLDTTSSQSEVQVLDNIDINKVVLNSKEVALVYQYVEDGKRQGDIFAGIGKNCSLYFGKNVEKIYGSITNFSYRNNSNTQYEVRQGLGNIKKVYITNPKTEQGYKSDYTQQLFSSDNDCTIYGYEGCDLYDETVKKIKTSSYEKLKALPYVKKIEVGNKEQIKFVNTKGFDEKMVRIYADLANDTNELLNYSEDGVDGYKLTKESLDKIKQTNGLDKETQIYIEFLYANQKCGTEVTMIPKAVTDFTPSVKENIKLVEGTKLDKAAFTLANIAYNDGTTDEIATEDFSVRLKSGNDTLTKGTNTVIVTYKGVEKEIDVTAETKKITKLTAKLKNENKKYYAGSTITSDDFEVTAEYNNGDVVTDFRNFTVSANIIPENVTAGTPYVIKINAEDANAEVALPISQSEISFLLASYSGAGVLEGDSVDKKNISVIAVYGSGKRKELKQDEYTLVYEPIKADTKNEVKIILLEDATKTTSIEVTGLKRTSFDPVTSPTVEPTLIPTTAPTAVPTVTPVTTAIPSTNPTVTPVVTVAPTADVTVPTTTPTTTPSISPVITPPVPTIVPIETVEPGPVPNTGATKLKANKYTLGVKEKATISLTGGKAVKFATSDKKIATVSQKGEIKAVKTGTVNIKVTDEFGAVKIVKVTVKKAPKSVKATVKSRTLHVGKKVTIKAKFTKGYYSNKLTYTSSNKKVATVSKTGVILAKKKGKTTITVKTYNGKKAKVTITVK